jgi:hypothetical protein
MENKQLTIGDMASLVQLLDAACTRGAFKGAEMRTVGVIYEKLTYFVEQSTAQLQQQPQQAQGEQNA